MSETPHRVASLSELQTKGRILIKHGDKQVALFHGPKASTPATTAARTKAIR